MNKGIPIILSGPSGSGKDTLLRRLFSKYPEILLSISCVTRPRRGVPQEDEKYRFISVEQFEDMIKNDRLLEYNVYVGNYYGTPREPVDEAVRQGRDIVLEIDVNGARNIRKKLPDAISIFIIPPSFEVLRSRLVGRGTDDAAVIDRRMKEALREIGCADEYDYVVVNDDLDTAANTIHSIIVAHKAKTANMKKYIDEVLENA